MNGISELVGLHICKSTGFLQLRFSPRNRTARQITRLLLMMIIVINRTSYALGIVLKLFHVIMYLNLRTAL